MKNREVREQAFIEIMQVFKKHSLDPKQAVNLCISIIYLTGEKLGMNEQELEKILDEIGEGYKKRQEAKK